MLITAPNISKSYQRKGSRRTCDALLPTDINIESGKLTIITGRSGSGKTTLLNILSGLLKPTKGNVLYDKTDIYSLSDKELSELRSKHTGFIPQGQSILSSLTVLENILLPAALAGNGEKNRAYADTLLSKLGLDELRHAYPNELSGGELRRAAIARALINSPKIIFADEPTNDLDDENTSLVFGVLKGEAEKGAAVVAVTHEPSARAYADTILKMNGGRLEAL